MPRSKVDQYPNRALVTCTMSAANTITFEQIRFGVGVFQGVALLLQEIDWWPTNASLRELDADTDYLAGALVNRDDLTSTDPSSQNNLVARGWTPNVQGTAGTLLIQDKPFVSSFQNLSGGGLLIPANPLYLAVNTVGFVAAAEISIVMYYTFLELKDSEYLELLQSMLPANI